MMSINQLLLLLRKFVAGAERKRSRSRNGVGAESERIFLIKGRAGAERERILSVRSGARAESAEYFLILSGVGEERSIIDWSWR
jgi:hypothetical protein